MGRRFQTERARGGHHYPGWASPAGMTVKARSPRADLIAPLSNETDDDLISRRWVGERRWWSRCTCLPSSHHFSNRNPSPPFLTSPKHWYHCLKSCQPHPIVAQPASISAFLVHPIPSVFEALDLRLNLIPIAARTLLLLQSLSPPTLNAFPTVPHHSAHLEHQA